MSRYSNAHNRIRKARGSASDYLCPCGAQARDWALMGEGPWLTDKPSRGNKPLDYSPNVGDYAPRCRSCHIKMDRDPHCKAGHLWDEKNSYFRPDGDRMCRRCHADRQAGYRRLKKPEQLTLF